MTHKIEFTESLIKDLEERLGYERDAKVYRRLKYLDLKQRGYSNQQISDILQVSAAQLTNWSKTFLEEDLEGLCRFKYEGRRHSRLEPYLEAIKRYITEQVVVTLAALQYWIKTELGIDIEQSWLSRWVKKTRLFLQKDAADSRQSARHTDSKSIH